MEQATLCSYLDGGGSVYLEGADFGYNNSGSALYTRFGCTYLGDGNATGNIQYLTGQSGTFVAGMSYNYLYNQGPDNYVDYIGPNGGKIFFRCQGNLGRAVYYDGPGGNTYRSIHSPHIFGALRDGADTKQELMDIYMDYLLAPTGVAESEASMIRDLSISPNPARSHVCLSFTLPQSTAVTVRIYNPAGQLVRQLAAGDIAAGAQTLIWDGRDNLGKEVSSGSYILRIEADQSVVNETVVLIK